MAAASSASIGAEYLSLKALATYAGLSERTLRSYLSHAVSPLPSYKIGGRVLVRKSDYDAWAARFRVVPQVAVDAIAGDMMRSL